MSVDHPQYIDTSMAPETSGHMARVVNPNLLNVGDLILYFVAFDGHSQAYKINAPSDLNQGYSFENSYTVGAIFWKKAVLSDRGRRVDFAVVQKNNGNNYSSNSAYARAIVFREADESKLVFYGNRNGRYVQNYTEYSPYTLVSLGGVHRNTTGLTPPSTWSTISYRDPRSYLTTSAVYKHFPAGSSGEHTFVSSQSGPFTMTAVVRRYAPRPPKNPTNVTHGYSTGDKAIGGSTLYLGASGAEDPEGSRVKYQFQTYTGIGWVDVGESNFMTHPDGVGTFTYKLPDSNHTARFRARAIDEDGMVSGWVETSALQVELSNKPPSNPSISYPTGWKMANSEITLTASESVDPNGGAVTYEFRRFEKVMVQQRDEEGNVIEETEEIRDTLLADTPNRSFTTRVPSGYRAEIWYTVQAKDNTGLVSAISQGPSFSVFTDPKSIGSITKSGDNREIGGNEVTVSTSGSSTDDGTPVVYDYEFFDGKGWQRLHTETELTQITHTVPDSLITGARYRVRAKDVRGIYTSWVTTSAFDIEPSFQGISNIRLPRPDLPQSKENIDYVREKTNELRELNLLNKTTWTDPVVVPKELPIKAVHMNEVQQAIIEVYDGKEITHPDPEVEQILREIVMSKDERYLINEDLLDRYQNMIRALQNI